MQVHKLDETHWIIQFEGSEKYDILYIAKRKRVKATELLRRLIINAVEFVKTELK